MTHPNDTDTKQITRIPSEQARLERTEHMLGAFSHEIQNIIEPPIITDDAMVMANQMELLDLVFRAIVTRASRYNDIEYYMAAVNAQRAYRQTHKSLHALRESKINPDEIAKFITLPAIDGETS